MKMDELGTQIAEQFNLTRAKLVVAGSTGVDSTVLINALVATEQIDNRQIIVAHVNHQLREQSTEEEMFLSEWCRKRQLKFVSERWPKEQHPQNGVEAAARDFRYSFFEKVMTSNNADVLLTAHNANEQVESFMMSLIRGGWLSELNGIPEKRSFAGGVLVRPFLKVPKQMLIAIAKKEHLKWFEDESNQGNEFLRNRVRNKILPLLEKENVRAIEHISDLQEQLVEQTALIKEVLSQKICNLKNGAGYDREQLKNESLEWQRLLLIKIIKLNAPELSVGKGKLEEALQFVNKTRQAQGAIDLGRDFYLEVSYNQVSVGKKKNVKTEQVKSHVVTLNAWLTLNETVQFRVTDDQQHTNPTRGEQMVLSSNQIKLPLVVRKAQPDDRLRLKNGRFKTVRRELIDQKVPNEMRSSYFAIIDSKGSVVWVPGLRKAWLAEPFLENNHQFTLDFRTGGRPNGQ